MEEFNPSDLKKLFVPKHDSKKGDNGRLMVIAGSVLFHAASIWPLEVSSKIVDMVYFSSVSMNNEIVQNDKNKFRNGIVVSRINLEKYVQEADCILIGPGLPRDSGKENRDDSTKDITERLLLKYPNRNWVIDGGSLQVISPNVLPKTSIITPNKKEFEMLFESKACFENAIEMAKKYEITILLKGEVDIVANKTQSVIIKGGNAGMTKGGTGDVLAGITASFYTKNDAFLSASCASYINKLAAERLYKTMGLYYNASDLTNEIPKVMKELIL
jgi:hydroxyethylthiazole kinase-like uncharacterized protein yjeF